MLQADKSEGLLLGNPMMKIKTAMLAIMLSLSPTITYGFDAKQFCDDVVAGKYEPHMKALMSQMMYAMIGSMDPNANLCDMKPEEKDGEQADLTEGSEECYNDPEADLAEMKNMFDQALASYVEQCGSEPNW